MNPVPLYFVWEYTDVDRAFWRERLDPWLPSRIFDAHTHVMHPGFRRMPMTDAMRRQYWVNEVFEPIDALAAEHCIRTVFPGREVTSLVFGFPDLDFDLEPGNLWLARECSRRPWYALAVVRPQWSAERVAAFLDHPKVVGVKPYYSLIRHTPESRDTHLEASIFDFLPHAQLELLNERRAWVTLHVPRAGRLGHPDNLREVREIRRRYPNLVLVLAHLGRCYTEPHAREALPLLAEDPGIHLDTSAVLNPVCHRIALEVLGPDRILYGTDNPILYMRGRRQYHDRTYLNRTSYPFHFNRDREPPEIESRYTLFMYEDLSALRQACDDLQLGRAEVQRVLHDNAANLMAKVLAVKAQPTSPESH